MLVATGLFVFSAAQTFVVAVAAERDFSRWRLRPDVRLVAVDYTVMTIAFLVALSPIVNSYTSLRGHIKNRISIISAG
jgi:hypothetical protein